MVPREPDVELADQAAALARSSGVSAVLGIGGGSTLDVAKAAAALATNPGSARDYLEGLPGPGPKAIAVATATGPVRAHDCRHGLRSDQERRLASRGFAGQAQHALRTALPTGRVHRSGAFRPSAAGRARGYGLRRADTFDRSVLLEQRFAVHRRLGQGRHFARNWRPAKPSSRHGRPIIDAYDLAIASTLGGICLANAGLGAAHGLIAPLGGLYPNIPHGAGLACLLPATLAINAVAAQSSASASARMLELWQLLAVNSGSDAMRLLGDLRVALGLPGLASYATIDVERVIKSPSGSLKTNPVPLGEDELSALLELALSSS